MTRKVLGLGKVDIDVLKRTVYEDFPLEKIPGLDGGVLYMEGKMLVSHSPSIGVPLESIGFFAFHYAASNVAERFAKPKHLIIGIYLPLETSETELKMITQNLGAEARKYGVNVIAGHTATYYGLEIPLITVTCLGEPTRKPEPLKPGDSIMLINKVGAEACWLDSLSKNEESNDWREFTPLPMILALQTISGVKLMHDVSEGGLKQALREISESTRFRLSVNSDRIPLHEGVLSLSQDPLRVPTFGTLIIAVSTETIDIVNQICEEYGIISSIIGFLEEGSGVYIDDKLVSKEKRMAIDWIYGSFKEQDEIIIELKEVVSNLESLTGFVSLIPQIGSNIVYAKKDARTSDDVAALTGRLINLAGKTHACGDVTYGGSKYTSSIILEALQLNPLIRSAISLRGSRDIVNSLESAGFDVKVLKPVSTGDKCPVTVDITNSGQLYSAYYHPGAFGVEPTITILAETPSKLLDYIKMTCKNCK